MSSIITWVRTKERIVIEEMVVSTLTCNKCGKQEEIEGNIDMEHLVKGWSSLTLESSDEFLVFQWLVCPDCAWNIRQQFLEKKVL